MACAQEGEEDEGLGGLKRGDQVGLLPGVHNISRNREKFALHVLLSKIRGPTSFEFLRTHEGVIHGSFTDAAFARGFIVEERGAHEVMRENEHLTLGERRRLLVNLLRFWRIDTPGAFFESFRESLYGRQETLHDRHQQLLRSIKALLLIHGLTPTEFGIPEPERFANGRTAETDNRTREENFFVQHRYTSQTEHEDSVDSLNADQRPIYDKIYDSVQRSSGGMVCIDAPGGTGKTYLLNTVARSLAHRGFKVVCTSSSGVASLLLIGGKTLHSTFNVPRKVDEGSSLSIDKNSAKAGLIRQLDCIIWDEITMFGYRVLDTLERSLRDLRDDQRPFGGVSIVLAGDWRQILPVIKNSSGRAAVVGSVLKKSSHWSLAEQYSLRRNMRVEGDDEAADGFRNFLLSVGDGTANEPAVSRDAPAFKMKMPDDMILQGTCQMSDLADHVYPCLLDMVATSNYPEWLEKRAIICGTNVEVDAYNHLLGSQLNGDFSTYHSIDEPRVQPGRGVEICPIDVLNSFQQSGFPPHKLELKVGMPVSLIRTLSHTEGHVNGARYVVTSCNEHSVRAERLSGDRRSFVFFRIKFLIEEDDFPVPFDRFQFPLRPSFAITANKAQGQTLERVGISILRDFFTHGQLYVALSRVKAQTNLKCLLPAPDTSASDGSDRFVDNVVYREVLNNYRPPETVPSDQINAEEAAAILTQE